MESENHRKIRRLLIDIALQIDRKDTLNQARRLLSNKGYNRVKRIPDNETSAFIEYLQTFKTNDKTTNRRRT